MYVCMVRLKYACKVANASANKDFVVRIHELIQVLGKPVIIYSMIVGVLYIGIAPEPVQHVL